jgi:hypothetical protein
VGLKDGSTLEELRVYASGTKENPMSPAQMADKFFDCAKEAVSAQAAKQIFAMLSTLGDQPSLADFLAAAQKDLRYTLSVMPAQAGIQ